MEKIYIIIGRKFTTQRNKGSIKLTLFSFSDKIIDIYS